MIYGINIWKEQIEHTVITGKTYGVRDRDTMGEDFGWSGRLTG
jgi:hypothetical protein